MKNGTREGSQGVPRDSWTAPGRNIAPRYLQDAPRRPPGEGLELFTFEFGRQHGPNLGPKMEPNCRKIDEKIGAILEASKNQIFD